MIFISLKVTQTPRGRRHLRRLGRKGRLGARPFHLRESKAIFYGLRDRDCAALDLRSGRRASTYHRCIARAAVLVDCDFSCSCERSGESIKGENAGAKRATNGWEVVLYVDQSRFPS